jgi:hypothetical protein
VTTTRTPYQDTAVSVERSKEAIRKALRSAGALGVQFDEEWGPEPKCRVRFIWPIESLDPDPFEGMPTVQQQLVRLEVRPLEPERAARGSGYRITTEQRERQAWRGLAHYLDATLKAAEFGLIRFEDIFLSFIETDHGQTIGEIIIPRLAQGPLALNPGKEVRP